jgi:hypothetical protein
LALPPLVVPAVLLAPPLLLPPLPPAREPPVSAPEPPFAVPPPVPEADGDPDGELQASVQRRLEAAKETIDRIMFVIQ